MNKSKCSKLTYLMDTISSFITLKVFIKSKNHYKHFFRFKIVKIKSSWKMPRFCNFSFMPRLNNASIKAIKESCKLFQHFYARDIHKDALHNSHVKFLGALVPSLKVSNLTSYILRKSFYRWNLLNLCQNMNGHQCFRIFSIIKFYLFEKR